MAGEGLLRSRGIDPFVRAPRAEVQLFLRLVREFRRLPLNPSGKRFGEIVMGYPRSRASCGMIVLLGACKMVDHSRRRWEGSRFFGIVIIRNSRRMRKRRLLT